MINCPCGDPRPDRQCATCGHRNLPGHPRRAHRGFVRVLDVRGGWDLCTLCILDTVVSAAEWARHDVTLLLDTAAIAHIAV